MSRKVQIEEEFDDETDLPLPSHPLPNTGARGPLLQELDVSDNDDDDDDDDDGGSAGSQLAASSAAPAFPFFGGQARSVQEQKSAVTDAAYKSWTCIYPIYIDAKRRYGTGQRRIERPKSLWWPLSKDIADAAERLGLGTLHEAHKSHPRDWENPGRVRVQWKKDGKLVNPMVKTKKQLLEMISFQIQHQKPENIPKPPYTLATPPAGTAPTVTKTSSSSKSKQPVGAKPKTVPTSTAPPAKRQFGRRLPVPPEPQPARSNRVSPYSPALSPGILIEAVKAGMNAEAANAVSGSNAPSPPAGMQKGKRKVVRVRG